jgi:uncharacterized protein
MANVHHFDRINSLKPESAKHWVVLAHVGSDAHGTKLEVATGGFDDTDYMGVVVPDDRNILGLGNWDCWVHGPDEEGLDVTVYSLKKFVGLLLKQNPNVLGMLWMRPEDYVMQSDSFSRLFAIRKAFCSKQAYTTFNGYATSQLYKMTHNQHKGYMGAKRKELVDKFGYDTKNAAHLIRLLRMGIEFLSTGELRVHRGGLDAQELMSIKRGAWTLDKVKEYATDLFADAEIALKRCPFPEQPDYETAEQYLIEVHRSFL